MRNGRWAWWLLGWVLLISALHGWLNVNWAAAMNDFQPAARRKVMVAYIPVTCQLTCPVTDYISKLSDKGELFLPRMFQGFPEIKEALIQITVYCGTPAGRQAFLAAHEALESAKD